MQLLLSWRESLVIYKPFLFYTLKTVNLRKKLPCKFHIFAWLQFFYCKLWSCTILATWQSFWFIFAKCYPFNPIFHNLFSLIIKYELTVSAQKSKTELNVTFCSQGQENHAVIQGTCFQKQICAYNTHTLRKIKPIEVVCSTVVFRTENENVSKIIF